MNILAFAGSNSKNSINKQLVSHVLTYFAEHECNLIDLNDFEMPLFSIDREKESGIPEPAHRFAGLIDKADLIICSFAEHNGAYSVAIKNIMDWASRIPGRKLWNDKALFVMATSTGVRGGSSVLDIATARMPFNGGRVVEKYSLPSFATHFIPGEGITNPDYKAELESKINSVKAVLNPQD